MKSAPFIVTRECPECGSHVRLRFSPRNQQYFIGCSGYPECKYTVPYHEEQQEMAQYIHTLEQLLVELDAKSEKVLH